MAKTRAHHEMHEKMRGAFNFRFFFLGVFSAAGVVVEGRP